MKIALIALLCGSVLAQSNQFRPALVQSNTNQIPNGCGSSCSLLYLDNVTSSNVLFIAIGAGFALTGESPTDSLGTSYSMGSVLSNGPDTGGGTASLQIGCGIAPSSGSNTVTVASQAAHAEAVVAEFSGIGTCTTDGTDTAKSATSGPATASLTTHPTTTNNNDVCITFGATWWATNNMWSNGNTVGGTGSAISDVLDYRIVGTAGSQSITVNVNLLSVTPGDAWLIRTQCYTPTFAVATDALPNGFSGVAYTAQLVSVGGSGSSRTWTVSSGSLPSGLSLNSATGAITGSTTPLATTSFTVQVSDGTHTSTRNLSIKIGASAATPAVIGFATFSPGPISYRATAGNTLLLGFWGSESSGSWIWTPRSNGTNNILSATPALSFHRIYPLPGVPGNNGGANGAPMSIYAACIPNSASYSISFLTTPNNSFVQANSGFDLVEINGVQGTIDDGFIANTAGFSSSPGSITVNGTSVVPNTLAIFYGNNASAINSPFTLIDAGASGSEFLVSAYDLVASAGSFSGTATSTCVTNCQALALSAEIVPLRPDISGNTCSGAAAMAASTERYKKQVW